MDRPTDQRTDRRTNFPLSQWNFLLGPKKKLIGGTPALMQHSGQFERGLVVLTYYKETSIENAYDFFFSSAISPMASQVNLVTFFSFRFRHGELFEWSQIRVMKSFARCFIQRLTLREVLRKFPFKAGAP